jgi:hypothetical protein
MPLGTHSTLDQPASDHKYSSGALGHSPWNLPQQPELLEEAPCHVHVTLDRGLRLGHDEVALMKGLAAENANDNQQVYGEPGDNRCKSLIIIHSVFLLSTMKVELSFVLLDLIGGNVSLTVQRPYRCSSQRQEVLQIAW